MGISQSDPARPGDHPTSTPQIYAVGLKSLHSRDSSSTRRFLYPYLTLIPSCAKSR